jgi:C-terminal processing protease CtpA/Prc
MRRAFLALVAALGCGFAWPAQESRQGLEDFDALWRAIDTQYAYFEGGHAAWKRAREAWRPKAAKARDRADLVHALEGAIAFLHDDSVFLSEDAPGSPRRMPADTDLWAEWKGSDAVVTAVRAFGDADVAGLRPGHVVMQIDGRPVDRVARDRLRAISASGPAAMDWALRHVLAGPRKGTVRLDVRDGRGRSLARIERAGASPASGPPIVARRMGEERDVGYIRIRNVLADPRLPSQFDAALDYVRDARALIIDLRETPDGGTRASTEAILARFAAQPTQWQAREAPGKPRVFDSISPKDSSPYRGRVVVLVDRWTAGEAESLAAGLEAVAKATLVGTPMAGLHGISGEVRLPNSGIVVRFPAEKAFTVDGTPREAVRPSIEVNLAAPSGGPGDPILYQALKLTERR